MCNLCSYPAPFNLKMFLAYRRRTKRWDPLAVRRWLLRFTTALSQCPCSPPRPQMSMLACTGETSWGPTFSSSGIGVGNRNQHCNPGARGCENRGTRCNLMGTEKSKASHLFVRLPSGTAQNQWPAHENAMHCCVTEFGFCGALWPASP